jgi:hypothetical protein
MLPKLLSGTGNPGFCYAFVYRGRLLVEVVKVFPTIVDIPLIPPEIS